MHFRSRMRRLAARPAQRMVCPLLLPRASSTVRRPPDTPVIMSDSSTPVPESQPDSAPPAPAGPKPMVMIGVIVLALGAGAGGGFALAPRLLPKAATAADSAAAHAEEGESLHEKGGKASGGKIFRIDNLIVNPAGSEGSRFLMASVA